MSVESVGAVCVMLALIGGGLKINEVELPRLPAHWVAALAAAGTVFIGLSLSSPELTDVIKNFARGSAEFNA